MRPGKFPEAQATPPDAVVCVRKNASGSRSRTKPTMAQSTERQGTRPRASDASERRCANGTEAASRNAYAAAAEMTAYAAQTTIEGSWIPRTKRYVDATTSSSASRYSRAVCAYSTCNGLSAKSTPAITAVRVAKRRCTSRTKIDVARTNATTDSALAPHSPPSPFVKTCRRLKYRLPFVSRWTIRLPKRDHGSRASVTLTASSLVNPLPPREIRPATAASPDGSHSMSPAQRGCVRPTEPLGSVTTSCTFRRCTPSLSPRERTPGSKHASSANRLSSQRAGELRQLVGRARTGTGRHAAARARTWQRGLRHLGPCDPLGRLPQPAPVRLRPGDHEVRCGRVRGRRPVEGPARRLDIRRRTLHSGRAAPCRSARARVAGPGRLQHSGRPSPCCDPRRAALDRRSCSGDSCGHIRRRPRRGPALRAPQPHDRRHGGIAGGRLGGHSCARRRPGPARDRDGVAQPHLSGGALPRDAPPARPGDSEPEVRGPRLREATARDVKLGRYY